MQYKGQLATVNMNKRDKYEFHEACKSGDLQLVKRLIDIDNINTTCPDGYTGFILACKKGHNDIIKFILNFTRRYSTHFRQKVLNKIDKRGHTGFIYACGYNHINVVFTLVTDEHVDVNLSGPNSINGFIAACYRYNVNIVKYLLTISKVDFNKKYKGKTPFMIVCENTFINKDKNKLIRLLIRSESIDVNQIDYKGNTAFITACIHNDVDIVKLLLSHDEININIVNNDGDNAYDVVKIREYKELERILLESGKLSDNKEYRCVLSIIIDRILSIVNE